MFSQTRAWQSYRQVATQTASPSQLVVLLYNGLIRFLEQARAGFVLDDPKEFNEAINNNLQRAQAVLNELNQALNMEEGGEFAHRMRGLYDYFDRRLQESNMAKTEPGIIEVIKHVTVLRDAWEEMVQRGASEVAIASLRSGDARQATLDTQPPATAECGLAEQSGPTFPRPSP
jgi:flagellar protein FliS